MDWKRLVLYPDADSVKNWPLYGAGTADILPRQWAFFRSVLEKAGGVPEWRFVLNLSESGQVSQAERLLTYAWVAAHEYTLVLPYQNLHVLDTDILRKSRAVLLCWDEDTVPDIERAHFYQTLDWAQGLNITVEVVVLLSAGMVAKVLEGCLVDRLLAGCRKIHFLVPKHQAETFLARTRFHDVLDYLVMKMKRSYAAGRIELDPCLLPVLAAKPVHSFPACASADTFHLLPDGGIKICPQGEVVWTVRSIRDFVAWLNTRVDERLLYSLRACYWRQTWNVQEPKSVYSLAAS
ncbi:hypothetical protein JW933_04250 [candidate division FCPU426 bacterium]|nr:hypothetical protein [candidate division FCPU426 bacterium]